jgi:DnaA family protein
LTIPSHPQSPLALERESDFSFENFHTGENRLAVEILRNLFDSTERQVYLWGGSNCGKTHLLNACHRAALVTPRRSFYLSLTGGTVSADIFEALDGVDLICLDNIDCVAGQSGWEVALFNLINDSRASGTRLVLSAATPPSAGGWQLADLVSRLSWGPVMQLQRLQEEDCLAALIERAEVRGMQFDAAAARYLMQRYSRDVGVLLGLVPLFDRETLAAGRRRITIPFVRRCLALD